MAIVSNIVMLFPSTVKIKDLKITPPLALAPMVGLSHSATRSLVMELGGVGLLFTEMLSAKHLPGENEKISPCLIRQAGEYPLFYQVFLNDFSIIPPVVQKLHMLRAQGIDLNFGCPAPQLRRQGAGCYLTKDQESAKRIISTFRKNTELPLSVKIRLGENLDERALISLCKIIEGEGADCLTIHARLNKEKFCRKPRWHWIAKVKSKIGIPVLANGGIFTIDDAAKCMEISGADGLMIGRGAAWRPWIFSDISEQLFGLQKVRQKIKANAIYFRFIEMIIDRFAEEKRLGRLKQFTHYFARTYTFGHHLASAVQTSTSLEQATERAEIFFQGNESLIV
jgi:nifR3 family TIM-barrel protein